MKKVFIKYWPALLILLIWFFFAHPFFTRGLIPFPSTYLVRDFAPWSAYPEVFAGPVKNAATPDVISQIYPWKQLVMEAFKFGKIPLWNPYTFSGTPLLANYQSAVFTPFNLMFLVFPFNTAWSLLILLQPLLAGVFMFLFARSLKISRSGSMISSIAFMFCGFITTWMVYGTLAYAILYLPLALFAIEKYFDKKNSWYLLILSFSFPLSFFSGHFQTSLYFAIFVFAYLVFKFFTTKKTEESILTFVSIFCGVFISMPQLLPSVELYFQSVRSDLFLKLESVPWGYLPTFLAPDFFGNPVTRNDWFGHYAEWNAYIGLIPLILGAYSIGKLKKYSIFFLAASIIVLALSFQSPLLDLLVSLKIPVLSTSAASRIIVLFSFSWAILAGFGFDRLNIDIKSNNYRNIFILIFAFLVLFAILGYVVFAKLLIPYDKNQIAFSNLRLPLALFGGFIMSIILVKFINLKNKLIILACILIILTAFDMSRFVIKWMPFESSKFIYPKVSVINFMQQRDDNYRSFGNFGAEAAINFDSSYPEGYDPLYIGRYGELVLAAQDGKYHKAERSVVNFPKRGKYSDRLLNLLGVKYLVQKKSDGWQSWVYPFWEYPVDQYVKKYDDEGYEVYENQKAFPRVLMISSYKVAKNSRDNLALIYNDKVDLKNTAILEEDIRQKLSTGSATIKKYSPNNIEIETVSSGKSLLFLSDPYYPGWNAYVDDNKVEILRADYAFRAIIVPGGKHYIKFVYDPDSFKAGLIAAAIGLIVIIGIGVYYRKR